MNFKHLITICLLLGSLNASAQSGDIKHLYDDTIHDTFYDTNYSPNFNNRVISDRSKRHLLLAEQPYISKAQAIEIARQRSDGKILSAKLIKREQHAFYKIKMLTDQGRIKTLRVNAKRR